jgi:hypothetical protein
LFERESHRRIASVLEALNAPLLAEYGCLFGGGTAIAMRYGEFRESVDIDFLVSNKTGYREIRQLLRQPEGVAAITARGLRQLREVRADQYGIRTLLQVDDVGVKFEIVFEARIELELPESDDCICGVATLTPLDLVTSKLLANSDRWADDSVFSRDLIDLAMMEPSPDLLAHAKAKARTAYGDSIESDLHKAVERLLAREGRLERCMEALRMTVPKALLWQRSKALAPRPRGKNADRSA